MARERKPRTNSEALMRWAENLRSNEVGPTYDVNSIKLSGDTIYHYGYHYPMAMIVRRIKKPSQLDIDLGRVSSRKSQPGKPIAVYVNTTRWGGSGGFGPTTDAVVSTLHGYLKLIADELGVPVYKVPLTGSNLILVEDNPDDPEPIIPELDIPVCPRKNIPTDPGPEPVDDGVGCIAGQIEEYSFQTTDFIWGESTEILVQDQAYAFSVGRYSYSGIKPGDFLFNPDCHLTDGTVKAIRYMNGRIVWGKDSYQYGVHKPHDTYRQCPHCKEFQERHRRWYAHMNGGWYSDSGQYLNIRMGWKKYCAEIERHGGVDEWREARSTLMRLIKQRKAERIEWLQNNSLPFEFIPKKKHGNVNLPEIDPVTGHISRKLFNKIVRQRKARERKRAAADRAKLREIERRNKEREKLLADFKKRILGDEEMADESIYEWLANSKVELTEDNKHAILYKRVHREYNSEGSGTRLFARGGGFPFEYTVGEWAIAEDYSPTRECGAGLHFAARPEETENHYGNMIIECHVPIHTMINLHYKVKAERCFVVREVEEGIISKREES